MLLETMFDLNIDAITKELSQEKPQETQPELVEIEIYGIPVESRTLPAAWKDIRLC
jgi:hypothetical protein